MKVLPDYCYYRARVAFHETDAARIVHFAQYLRYAEIAETHALHGCGMLEPMIETSLGLPRVKLEAEYMRPLRFWEEYEVRAEILSIGASSLRWQFTLSGEQGVVAQLSWVTARVDAKGKKASYSEQERQLLSQLIVTP